MLTVLNDFLPETFQFQWPWMGLLLLMPALFLLFFLNKSIDNEDSQPQHIRLPHDERLRSAYDGIAVSELRHRFDIRMAIVILIWSSLVFALMRPQIVDRFTHMTTTGHDIVLAVDLSESMKALDFSTNNKVVSRLDVTKNVVKSFVKQRNGDRIGLVLFGEYAYIQAPLTLDIETIGRMLVNDVSGMAGDSTAIGDAIGMTIKMLRNRPEESRIVILLTDGDDTASSIPPLGAAKLAAQYGIRIYTIGIGKSGSVPFPTRNNGVVMVNMTMNEALLKEIAEITKGRYFHATDGATLEGIYENIDMMEKTESEAREFVVRNPLYRYPAGFALFLILLFVLISVRRSSVHAA